MATALIGLLGVALGALLATWGTYAMQRRLERGGAYVAAEFIRRDLRAARKLLEAAEGRVWWSSADAPQFTSWHQHGAALFAGRVPGGRAAFKAASSAIALVNNISAEVAGMYRLADTERELAKERLSALNERKDDDLTLQGDESPAQAREREKRAIQGNLDREIRRLMKPSGLDKAIADLKAAELLMPEAPPEPSDLAKSRKRQLRKPRGIAVIVGGLVVLAFMVIVTVSIVQGLLSPYTPESVAAAVSQTRDAEFASCDKDDGVEDSWTCQLGHARDAAACNRVLQIGAASNEAIVIANASGDIGLANCTVSGLQTTKELQQEQLSLLGHVTKETGASGEEDSSPVSAPLMSKVKDRRTLLDRLLGSNK